VSASSSNPQGYPNLVFIAPAPGWLDVVACLASGRELRIVWQERRPLPEQASFLPRLGEILKAHALRPDTPAVLLVPPGVGGLLAVAAPANAWRDAAWCRRQLELAVPFPFGEIRHAAQGGGEGVRLFWVPAAWLAGQKTQLAKFGLKLAEVCPRARLFEGGRLSPAAAGVLVERLPQGELLYDFAAGVVRQAAALPPGIDAEARSACLAGVHAAGNVAPQELEAALPPWEESLPALWREPGLSIPADGGAAALWSPFFRLAMLLAVVATVLAGALSWGIAAKEEALRAAQREKRKLAPQGVRFQELDRSLREEQAVVDAVARLNATGTPLPLLARLTQVLPKNAWVQRLTFDGKAIVAAGKGIGDDELIRLLEEAGLAAEQMRQEPVTATEGFRLRIMEKPQAEPAKAAAAAGGKP
jgi:hypothetical protein